MVELGDTQIKPCCCTKKIPAAVVFWRCFTDLGRSSTVVEDTTRAAAIQMSVQEGASGGSDPSNQADMSKLLADQNFVYSILASLPRVDPNDPHVKDLLASMQNQSEPNKEEDKAPEEEEKK